MIPQMIQLAYLPVIAALSLPAPMRKFEGSANNIGFRANVTPAAPTPGQTFVVSVEVAELLASPHPTYGKRRPADEANVQVIFVAPTPEKPAKGAKAVVAESFGRQAVRLADSGTFAAAFTPTKPGVYGVYFRGQAGDKALDYGFAIAVGVDTALEASIPSAPATLPTIVSGDDAHGKSVCAELCKKDIPWALPQGSTPTFLAAASAEGMNDATLLNTFVGGASLDPVQKADVLHYLRGLHTHTRDLWPDAQTILFGEYTINKYGRDRLAQIAKITLTDDTAKGSVLVVYQGEPQVEPLRVGVNDRIARDHLSKKNKIGYVVFTSIPGEPRAHELAIALGMEPTYAIKKITARGADGSTDAAFNKDLATFAGQGKFNDPKSLAKGSPALREKVLAAYLKATELATMYFADEREFTAFDSEFGQAEK